tara:strand:- start:5210 stop:7438 length:2229 start_codon:yes stop_codon:yes gene_type:complete
MTKILTFALIIALSGCGLIKDEKEVTEYYDIGGLETGCTLVGDRFHKILEQNIETDIQCLESSLKQFADYVRRENPKYIKRTELEKFINRFFPDTAAEINKILKPAFKLLSLLLKDPSENIAVANIPLVANIIRVINQQGRELSDLLKVVIEKAPADGNETEEERKERLKRNSKRYWENKSQLVRTTNSMIGRLVEIISTYPSNTDTLDVPAFLEELKIALELSDEDFNVQTIKSFLFAKKLLLGGDAYILKSKEVNPLLNKLTGLVEVAMDAMFISERPTEPGDEISTDIDKSRFLMSLVKRARQMIFVAPDQNEVVLDFDNLLNVLKIVMEDVSWDRTTASLINFKKKIIGGDAKTYTYNDFNTITNIIREASEISFFNNVTYRHFAHVMTSDAPIEGISLPNLPEYTQFSEARRTEMWGNFLFIAKNYHFFLDRDGYQTIGFKIKRHSYGFNILSLMRWGVKKLFVAYGRVITAGTNNEFVLDLEDTRIIAEEYKGILEELELWPDDLERLLSELRLGSDLFRMNSNGDNYIQIDEINEYISTLMASGKIKANVLDKIKDICTDVGTADNPAYDLVCFNEHFFNILFVKLQTQKHLPNLHTFYLKHNGTDMLEKFITAVQVKARIINNPDIPVDGTDISRMLTSLSNIETLFKRFDANFNHELKGSEIDGVYGVVESVIAAADDNLKPGAKLTKSAFLYVVKKEKLPSGIGLILFHINPLAKLGIKGDRLKIARVLGLF